jgi:hypothetical protein
MVKLTRVGATVFKFVAFLNRLFGNHIQRTKNSSFSMAPIRTRNVLLFVNAKISLASDPQNNFRTGLTFSTFKHKSHAIISDFFHQALRKEGVKVQKKFEFDL